jgi:hypothetical protein
MIKALVTMRDGRIGLVLGLSQANIDRLRAEEPIFFDVAAMKMHPTDRLGGVSVFYGRDEAHLTAQLRQLIGPDTEVIVVPQGDPRPQ